MSTCVLHSDTPATLAVFGIDYCGVCVDSLTATAEKWSAEREQREANDTTGRWVCATLGCIHLSMRPNSSYVGLLCQVCDTAKRAETDRQRAERNRERQIAQYALAAERAARAEEWCKRPCVKCGGDRQGARNQVQLCPACHRTYKHDVAYRAAAKRRAHKRSAQHEPYKRSEIFARWGNLCAYCDAPAEHLDHVNPLSKGGADAAHNLLPACAPCNLTKSAKTLADWASTF